MEYQKLERNRKTADAMRISAKKEEVEKCYGKVEKVMTQLNTGKNRQVVIMGDFNGRIGCNEINGITGKWW